MNSIQKAAVGSFLFFVKNPQFVFLRLNDLNIMQVNKLFLVVCVLVMVQSSFAQKLQEIGLKGGFSYSDLNLSQGGKLSGTTYHPAVGYHVGGYALIKFNKKFSVQPELLYSMQGQYFTNVTYSNLKTTLNYVNIPVIVKYYLVKSLNVQAGPQLGILVSAKGDLVPYGPLGPTGRPVFNQDLSSYLKSMDLAIAFGAGVTLPGNIDLNVRYNVGITDINKNTDSVQGLPGGLQPSFSTAYTRNQVFQVSLGHRLYGFNKSKK